jgi:PAS domain S-box-containing protein
MRLQTKIALSILPLVIGSIFLLGLWTIHRAEEGIHESTFRYMETILNVYISDRVEPLHRILVRNGLTTVPSYVAAYQKRAMAAAGHFDLRQKAHIFAFDESGDFVFCSLGKPVASMMRRWSDIARKIAQEPEETVRARHTAISDHHIYTARRFPPWNWVIFLAMPDDVVHAAQVHIQTATLGMAVLCAAASILLILAVFQKFFVRPMTRIMAAATDIAEGRRVEQIPVHSDDELGQLARNMEAMSAAIRRYQSEQTSWRQELEIQVQRQTAHLQEVNAALTASEARYRSLFNTMHDGFALHEIICDPSGHPVDYRFIEANPAFGAMTGMRPEAVVGKRVREVLPEVEPEWIQTFGEVALKGEPNRFELYSGPLKRHFDVTAYSPQSGRFATIFADVTNRKRLESQLQQAQKMEAIGTLAGGIAHDFNNILFPIIGYTEMTLDRLEEGSREKKNLEEVLSGAHRARDLVAQILTFSRQGDREVKPLRIQLVVKEVVKLLRSTMPATIDIRERVENNGRPVLADPTQVHQIIMNLCTNAYHAMRESGGLLEIGLKEVSFEPGNLPAESRLGPGSYQLLTVSDTGGGMDAATLHQIFDPYFTTKGKGEGTGLGLSVVHGIVKTYGGDIQVASCPGEGSTFHVYLPAVDRIAESPTVDDNPPVGGRERILVVDDEAPLRRMLNRMLASLGYDVTCCRSGREALDTFLGGPDRIDLVITDMTMPQMTGIQLTRELLDVRPDLPIILCTGFSALISEESAAAIGIRKLVMKPVVRREMAEAIRGVLDGEQAPA